MSHFSDLHGKLDFMWWLVVLWMVSQLFSHQAISDNTLKKYCYSASLVKLKFLGMCVCVLKGSIHFGWEFAWLLAVWIWLHTVIFLNNLLASFMDIVFCTIVHDASTLVFWVQHWWVFCSTLVGFFFNMGVFALKYFLKHLFIKTLRVLYSDSLCKVLFVHTSYNDLCLISRLWQHQEVETSSSLPWIV